jgi:alpha-L-fucosidase
VDGRGKAEKLEIHAMNERGRLSRRTFVRVAATAMASACVRTTRAASDALASNRPRPSPSQLDWQRDELAMFLHFGVNTFSDREWGDGHEDPRSFAPASLDARQWARSARDAGFRAVILTAKHHDGFCLWPTGTTSHSVASSPFRGGHGDVVREFVDACRAEGLKPGLYLSPWDRNNPAYGDSSRYNSLYVEQLTELLTRYGPIAEVWFDGANGEGPNGKKQVYDWPRVFSTVRRLQPNAVMFSDAGPDVRWCGNERGVAGDPNWSTVNPTIVTYPGADGPGIIDALQHGDPLGTVWRPAEVDVSIRPGWFHHASEDARVRSVDDLMSLYFTSVGRNGKLLLNVPPTRDGLLHATDVVRLREFRERRDSRFAEDVARARRHEWRATGDRTARLEMDLAEPATVSVARLSENVSRGQRVARYTLECGERGDDPWRNLASGTTIGYAKLDRFPPVRLRRIRLTIEDAVAAPEAVTIKLFA